MDIEEYKTALARHDWYYNFSDDHRVWSSGEQRGGELLRLAIHGDDDFKRAYNEVTEKHFNTESFYPKNGDRKWEAPFKL
jgi:hypothetical protein